VIRIAIDRGGTFTDIYAIVDGKEIITKKILSDSSNYDDPHSYGVEAILKELGREYGDIEWIRIGTTVATNALLERKGADVTLLVTKGFRDLLEIRYQDRPDLFALAIEKPRPLYKEVLEVDERVVMRDGLPVVERPLREVPTPTYRSVAVVLLHADLFRDHEEAVKERLSQEGFDPYCSSDVIPLVKAVDRGDTTVVDAYLTPVVQSYSARILAHLPVDSEKISFMKSDGGLCRPHQFRGVNSLLSGPAGGVVALQSIYDGTPIIGFDMGGTSTDVSRYDGEIGLKYSAQIGGSYISYPMVDIHTVAAGGGSRLFYRNGLFVVGPESSGSDPGPVCYGRGGELSITDANLVTGRLDPSSLPSIFGPDGKSPLDIEAAREAFKPIAAQVGRSIEEVAEAFIDVANEQMATAIKEITIKKGYDPKDHILAVFGGAGGQHAVAVARKLGIRKIFIHRHSGILSAVGIAYARESGELIQTSSGSVERDLAQLRSRLPQGFQSRPSLFVRFSGTNTSLEVPYQEGYEELFKERYREIYGFLPDGEVEVEAVKLSYFKENDPPPRPKIEMGESEPSGERSLFLDGTFLKVPVYTELKGGSTIMGPALIALDHSTILLDRESVGRVNEYGDLTIELKSQKERVALREAKLSLLANRLMFIAQKMGDMLQKSAKSVNIKERADFSCAIFDGEGDLIVNAPHIPVHLGSMSSVVKSIIQKGYEDATYITNLPSEGGSHLPDITVVTPYIEGGETLFWVASRGHHADIGGTRPGSMPPFSQWLWEEGARIPAFPLLKGGVFQEERLRSLFMEAGARTIDDNISDVKAQIAANREGVRGVLEIEREDLLWFFQEIKRVSRRKVEAFLEGIERVESREFLDMGAQLSLQVYREGEKVVFDFSGSSPQLLGNQNCPPAVVRSALLYSLRTMIGEDIPLNEGLLEPVEIRIPKESLLDPEPSLAVVGGNVTTSQRIVDLIFKAFRVAAASQGCMNNLLFGSDSFGYYETICGGSGAIEGRDGASGVHTHMTNTKITDVEVIERRFPVVIEEFSIREGSGGAGKYRGGDGVRRIYRFLEEMEVSLLTERRVFAPYGLEGGEPGAKGVNTLIRGEKIYNLGGKASFTVRRGDRVVIETPGGGGWGTPTDNGDL